MSDQLQGERRKLIARYEALVTSSWRKQLYFSSGFKTGPVYHLRVVEQKLSFAHKIFVLFCFEVYKIIFY